MKTATGWLPLGRASKLVGCSHPTLWRWVVSGIVPRKSVLKVGKHSRVSAEWCRGVANG